MKSRGSRRRALRPRPTRWPFRNRIHIDLSAPDRDAEVQRLLRLGATLWRREASYTTLRDPEGNPFCIADA
jgi:hypothetical protein